MAKVVGFDPIKIPRATCSGCGVVNEYQKAEMQKHTGTDWAVGAGREWIICANCGYDITTRYW